MNRKADHVIGRENGYGAYREAVWKWTCAPIGHGQEHRRIDPGEGVFSLANGDDLAKAAGSKRDGDFGTCFVFCCIQEKPEHAAKIRVGLQHVLGSTPGLVRERAVVKSRGDLEP